MLVVGLISLLYPLVSDEVNNLVDQQIISHYQRKANKENEAAMKKEREKMEAANKKMAAEGNSPGLDPFTGAREDEDVATIMNSEVFQKHTVGIISIPKIKVKLPIFDQTTELFLSQGASLLGGTSYPTGGESTHSVISAHRGLSKAKFFTDLPELKLKDQFYIEINDEIHAYEVDQIKVIEPTETKDLVIEEGKDYVTLLTCTPYMINTHRLIVRGHRIPYKPTMKKTIKKADNQMRGKQILIFSGVLLLILLIIWVVIHWIKKRRLEKRKIKLSENK